MFNFNECKLVINSVPSIGKLLINPNFSWDHIDYLATKFIIQIVHNTETTFSLSSRIEKNQNDNEEHIEGILKQ